jgi:hypothetical protein
VTTTQVSQSTLISALLGDNPAALTEDISLATPRTLARNTGPDAVVAALGACADVIGATDADLRLEGRFGCGSTSAPRSAGGPLSRGGTRRRPNPHQQPGAFGLRSPPATGSHTRASHPRDGSAFGAPIHLTAARETALESALPCWRDAQARVAALVQPSAIGALADQLSSLRPT